MGNVRGSGPVSRAGVNGCDSFRRDAGLREKQRRAFSSVSSGVSPPASLSMSDLNSDLATGGFLEFSFGEGLR
jgi:hypothetical protein